MIVGLVLDYNDAQRTMRCVDSLLADGIDRVVVWENSDDKGISEQVIRGNYADDARVQVGSSGKNLGFSAGVNAGIAKCGPSARVLLINNDATLVPGAIRQLDMAMTNGEAAVVYPSIDHAGELVGNAYYHRLTGLYSKFMLPGSVEYASGCCLLVDTAYFCGKPVMDEDFFMYGEDVEFGWRLAQENLRLIHVPLTLVNHEVSASSRNGSRFYETQMVLAHLLLAKKLSNNSFEYVVGLVFRLATLTARAGLRAARSRSLVPLIALVRGFLKS